jgi:hypothetical protein
MARGIEYLWRNNSQERGVNDHPLEAPTAPQRIHGTNGDGGHSHGDMGAEEFTYFADAGTEGRLASP